MATSYMIEKELVEPEVKEMYNRKKDEVRASHILIRLQPDASPADTLEAYNKAMKVISLVPKFSFDTLAVTYSEDQSASFNRGDMGFFTLGRMVAEFEDACYSMKAGEYTHTPIRTQFGYHIIKVTDRQPNKGAVRISHILKRFTQSLQDTVAIKDSIEAIYRKLQGGMDFAEAAKQYSDDGASKPNGGDIGYYERAAIPPPVGKIFFGTPVGSFTAPFRQSYGYHIFKITGFQGIGTFQELEKDLKQQFQQMRYNTEYQNYVHDLKKKYSLNLDVVLLNKISHAFDTTKTPSIEGWSDTLDAATKSKVLFSYGNKQMTMKDFIDHISTAAEFKTFPLRPSNIEYIVERLTEAKILEEHAKTVPERHPEFAKLMQEYQDGVLLYRIEQDEVWKKIVVNDSLLRIYYGQVKEKYRWPDRVNFVEVLVQSDSLAQIAYKKIQKGKSIEEVAAEYTTRPGYKEKKGAWGFQPTSQNYVTRYAAIQEVDSIPKPFQGPDGWHIVKTIAKDSARVKTFEESSPELSSAYQEYVSKQREQEWLGSLKEKYHVMLNKEMLQQAFKRKRVEKQ
ncbi:MAG: peptidylprolyl isomerase [Ignavibacteriales bacterium]|nr:peptidylprolyl isomerase [Ignavibacteriales bacterium]